MLSTHVVNEAIAHCSFETGRKSPSLVVRSSGRRLNPCILDIFDCRPPMVLADDFLIQQITVCLDRNVAINPSWSLRMASGSHGWRSAQRSNSRHPNRETLHSSSRVLLSTISAGRSTSGLSDLTGSIQTEFKTFYVKETYRKRTIRQNSYFRVQCQIPERAIRVLSPRR
jgi:hypothetical protein